MNFDNFPRTAREQFLIRFARYLEPCSVCRAETFARKSDLPICSEMCLKEIRRPPEELDLGGEA